MKYKCSVLVVFSVLLLFLVSFLIPSLKMESSENRTMATFGMVFRPEADSVVYHDSPVERLDAALSDQFAYREFAVKKYLALFNTSENYSTRIAKKLRLEKPQFMLHAVGSYELIGETGYVTVYPSTEPMNASMVQRHVEQFETLHARYPELNIYAYYVSEATDTPWIEQYIGVKPADHYQEIIDAVPDYVKTDHLVYEDLDDYMNLHYKTDHHWNHRGSRRGYEDIFTMMSADMDMGELLVPTSENTVSQTYGFQYRGSYGKALGDLYKGTYDEFSFYEYDFPEQRFAILNPDSLKETEAAKIGLYDEYREGKINKSINEDHYITLYGTARDMNGRAVADEDDIFIIRSAEGNGKNLLICGDSYSRTLRDPLAAHFDTTVYFDYRLLAKVPIDTIIERYGIDVLLISSNTSMWGYGQYLFTFGEDK